MSASHRPPRVPLRAFLALQPRHWLAALFVALLVIVWFAGIGTRSLIEPDEGRYAEIAREMFASGDWVMPRFDGFKFYDKPPLQYWATTLSYQAFGVQHWTARLFSALTGLLSVVAVWYAGRRVWDPRRGRLAALVCVSLFLVVAAGHINSLDMGVAAFLTVALATFLIAEHGCDSTASQRRWMLATWAAMGLAVLSKGLIGVVLPGATLFVYVLWQRDWALLRRLQLIPGLAILLALTAPWFVLLARRDDQFLSFFFIHEHFGRFLSKVANRNQPFWYYLPILIAGLLPWTAFLSASLRNAWRHATREKEGATRLVLIWTVVVLLFFSLSGAKLPLYVLPMFPAFAWLIASAITQLESSAIARRLLPIAILAAIGLVLTSWLPYSHLLKGTQAAYAVICIPIAVSMALLAAGTGIAWLLARRGRSDAAIAAAALGGLLFTQALLFAYQRLAPTTSAQALAAIARPYVRADAPVYTVQMFYRGLPFYLQRPVTLVAERPYDLLAGIDWEPQLQIAELSAFATAWTSHPGALAFMPQTTFQTLAKQQLPMQVVARTSDTVIVQNPTPR
jgi:4-amino-4-deoxy-L-arabinose transferase-like glycosyltransferase